MIYHPKEIVDVDDATAIELILNARRRLVFARRNDDSTPDTEYVDLIEALDCMLELTAAEFDVLEWHAWAFQIDERFEQALSAGYGQEFSALIADLRDLVAMARYISRERE
ncbi:hypothetical protein [Burkholderia pseudomallei]|uniref:hypothetical protein n=1 Tax=Burkholderia pseudomallei TaxID=28450 RepID=UPI0005369EA5|nr:hypothetical protein [Burkholderia pseudomallei]KGW18169.1 hypothetical protein X980_5956 [Burkholderia pseudomallei MSHR4000]KGW80993.1 hypothetical protein Y048_4305 [Burkholderia pseudomallei MSHR456]KGX23825.1 hypothetical protein X896_6233 [Burkholderia pseudomallei ABCPW 1]MBF3523817.1 hypothetical protein [Burkholderia pseudomallei]MBF3536843.1 hypothetical protein [Burkholderia pseudomallei]